MRFISVCLLSLTLVHASPLPRSVSTSRQFIVFGGDAHLRGSVAQLAEQVKADLLRALGTSDRWSVPILLNLAEPQANLPEVPDVALNFSQTGAGLKIQLDLLVGRDLAAALPREIVRALLLEMSYRGLPALPAGELYRLPPDWLVEGILTLRNEAPAPAEARQNLTSGAPSLEQFLSLHPALLDSQSQALYSAMAGTLLRTLLEAPDGPAQLQRYIAEWPRASSDAAAELRAHFPALGKDPATAEKSWRTCLGHAAGEQGIAVLTFGATEEQLADLLGEPIAQTRDGKQSLRLEETVATSRPRIDAQKAAALAQRLALLAARAHPLLRPTVLEYQRAAENTRRGHLRGMAKRLAATAELHQRIASRMRDVEDYMNWFEATQSRTPSGSFRQYVQAAENGEPVMHRHDPLSVYLDAMENQMQ